MMDICYKCVCFHFMHEFSMCNAALAAAKCKPNESKTAHSTNYTKSAVIVFVLIFVFLINGPNTINSMEIYI